MAMFIMFSTTPLDAVQSHIDEHFYVCCVVLVVSISVGLYMSNTMSAWHTIYIATQNVLSPICLPYYWYGVRIDGMRLIQQRINCRFHTIKWNVNSGPIARYRVMVLCSPCNQGWRWFIFQFTETPACLFKRFQIWQVSHQGCCDICEI